jgi:hypothetical protein
MNDLHQAAARAHTSHDCVSQEKPGSINNLPGSPVKGFSVTSLRKNKDCILFSKEVFFLQRKLIMSVLSSDEKKPEYRPNERQAELPGGEANWPKPPRPAEPSRKAWINSRLAKRSLKLAIASIITVVLAFLFMVTAARGDSQQSLSGQDDLLCLPFVLLFSFLGIILAFAAFLYGAAAWIQKLIAIPLKRKTPPLWPALVGMVPLLLMAFWPNFEQMAIYLKTGIWFPRRIMFGLNEVEANFKNIVPKLETRYQQEGAYYTWAPWSTRRNQFEALKTLPPEIATLPTFAFSDAQFKNRSDLNLHPSQFGDPFSRPVARLAHAYYTTTTQYGGAPIAGYIIWSCGPDGHYDLNAGNIAQAYNPAENVPSDLLVGLTYDPSNGAASGGDIVRCKKPDAVRK